jgi:hypothetical protein
MAIMIKKIIIRDLISVITGLFINNPVNGIVYSAKLFKFPNNWQAMFHEMMIYVTVSDFWKSDAASARKQKY